MSGAANLRLQPAPVTPGRRSPPRWRHRRRKAVAQSRLPCRLSPQAALLLKEEAAGPTESAESPGPRQAREHPARGRAQTAVRFCFISLLRGPMLGRFQGRVSPGAGDSEPDFWLKSSSSENSAEDDIEHLWEAFPEL
uniref:Uncharacterized protein n=1 Tax=Sphaerodactylus townsendi TaxID=933632 RepID=A0ACB8GDF5_9SAUR